MPSATIMFPTAFCSVCLLSVAQSFPSSSCGGHSHILGVSTPAIYKNQVPSGGARVNGFSALPIPQLFKELITNEDRPFSRKMHHQTPVQVRLISLSLEEY